MSLSTTSESVSPPRHTRPPGFTLVELLIVVTIIIVLAAVVFPVVIGAKKHSLRTTCTANLRNHWLAFELYAQDGGGWSHLPRYVTATLPYGKSKEIFRCPSDPRPAAASKYRVVFEPPLEDTIWVDYPVSYLYVRHYIPASNLVVWEKLLRRHPNIAFLVCPWHGVRARTSMADPFPYYVGKLVRLRTDGSIKAVAGLPDSPQGNGQTVFSFYDFFVRGAD